MNQYCENMPRAAESQCDTHKNRFDCPDALVTYSPKSRTYGIIIHDGGSSSATIHYCSWCRIDSDSTAR